MVRMCTDVSPRPPPLNTALLFFALGALLSGSVRVLTPDYPGSRPFVWRCGPTTTATTVTVVTVTRRVKVISLEPSCSTTIVNLSHPLRRSRETVWLRAWERRTMLVLWVSWVFITSVFFSPPCFCPREYPSISKSWKVCYNLAALVASPTRAYNELYGVTTGYNEFFFFFFFLVLYLLR